MYECREEVIGMNIKFETVDYRRVIDNQKSIFQPDIHYFKWKSNLLIRNNDSTFDLSLILFVYVSFHQQTESNFFLPLCEEQDLTAQSIDFKREAQPESDTFIPWNCFARLLSSVELQHVLPL